MFRHLHVVFRDSSIFTSFLSIAAWSASGWMNALAAAHIRQDGEFGGPSIDDALMALQTLRERVLAHRLISADTKRRDAVRTLPSAWWRIRAFVDRSSPVASPSAEPSSPAPPEPSRPSDRPHRPTYRLNSRRPLVPRILVGAPCRGRASGDIRVVLVISVRHRACRE